MPNVTLISSSTNRPSWRVCYASKMKLVSLPQNIDTTKGVATQAGLLRSQRQRNLAGSIAVPQDQRHRIANQLVLVIDDLMTTGATLNEALKPFIGREMARLKG